MTITDLENLVPDFAPEFLLDYEIEQQELKALTVQKYAAYCQSIKWDTNQLKNAEFWQRNTSNLRIFREPSNKEFAQLNPSTDPRDKLNHLFEFAFRNTPFTK